ncbi:MAG TPA: IS200/IS605 family transposase [Candidatus Kryptonia bacterium]
MSYLKLWIHFVWSTKYREKTIAHELKGKLINHIIENARDKGIYIDAINCVEDHVHVLVSLGATQSVSAIAQLLKGESSHWVNATRLLRGRFEWQDDFAAFSVSDGAVYNVREYIKNQEAHHRMKSFSEEFEEILEEQGLKE